jgi:hypothetical protein
MVEHLREVFGISETTDDEQEREGADNLIGGECRQYA